MPEVSPTRYLVTAGWDDAPHLNARAKAELLASTPPHLRDARSKGIPAMGSGRIFPVDEELIKEPRIDRVPGYWRQIIGLDFGWDHPSAAVLLYHDADIDVVHVRATHRMREATPVYFAAGIRPWGVNIPVAWPHDGLQHDKGSGKQLAEQYRAAGLNMLPDRATFEDGTHGVEAGLTDMLDRMQSGRFKVDASLHDWFEEFRLYHRKNGVVVKERDDLMSATRYALMMIREAVPVKGIERRGVVAIYGGGVADARVGY